MPSLKPLLRWWKKQPTPSTEVTVKYPPIVMRLYAADKAPSEEPVRGRDFLFRDWRYGELNEMTVVIAKRLAQANEAFESKGKVRMITLPLDDRYLVTVAQLQAPEEVRPVGAVGMVLYISADDKEIKVGKDLPLYGAFTKDLMNLLTHICIRLNCVVTALHSTADGGIVAMFKPHDPKYDLEQYFNQYYNNQGWMNPEIDNGFVDRASGATPTG